MTIVTIIGVDLAKNVFQLHGTTAEGPILFRKKLSRPQFHRFMSDQPASTVVMEACGGANYWARELESLGHHVRLISPQYVKPFVKRQKNDAADAEAIVEASLRPNMRFVEPKTEAQQASAVLFRFREKMVQQRTELINSIRSYLFEFGHVIPKGTRHLRRVVALISDETMALPVIRSSLTSRSCNVRLARSTRPLAWEELAQMISMFSSARARPNWVIPVMCSLGLGTRNTECLSL